MPRVEKSYAERLDEMSFEELQKLADAAIEKYEKDGEILGKNNWTTTAKVDSINDLHKRVRAFYSRMAKKNKDFDFNAAMAKLPSYTMEKTAADVSIVKYLNSRVAKHKDTSIGNLYQQEHANG